MVHSSFYFFLLRRSCAGVNWQLGLSIFPFFGGYSVCTNTIMYHSVPLAVVCGTKALLSWEILPPLGPDRAISAAMSECVILNDDLVLHLN